MVGSFIMATTKDVASAVAGGTQLAAAPKKTGLQALLADVSIKQRFEEMLGKKAAGFISSVISVTNQNKLLQTADPMTVISAAAIAASLDLPVNPSLAFAHIVPYKDNKAGTTVAQFQMGWRGFVQLAMRSGKYKTMNVSEVYEGELVKSNRHTGEMEFDETRKASEKVIGYVAYIKLINGFKKYLYMTTEQVTAHGKRYSKSFYSEYGQWEKNFDAMAKKTVLKMLLSMFGILSIEMERAVETDQAVIKDIGGSPEYIDNAIDTESAPTDEKTKGIIDSFGEEKK
jgi:recombination protein RecT